MTDTNQASEEVDRILSKYEIGFVTHGKDVSVYLANFKDELLQLIQQDRERAVREARIDELKRMCRKHWQLPIPERAMLDRIKELSNLTQDKEK